MNLSIEHISYLVLIALICCGRCRRILYYDLIHFPLQLLLIIVSEEQ